MRIGLFTPKVTKAVNRRAWHVATEAMMRQEEHLKMQLTVATLELTAAGVPEADVLAAISTWAPDQPMRVPTRDTNNNPTTQENSK